MPLHLATVAGGYAALALIGMILSREANGIAVIWPPNGFLVGLLLTSTRRHWPGLIGAGLAGNLLANLLFGSPLLLSFGLAAVNLIEFFAAALATRLLLAWKAEVERTMRLLVFALAIAPCAALISGLGAAVLLQQIVGADYWEELFRWWAADTFGLILIANLTVNWPRAATVFDAGHRLLGGLTMVAASLLLTVLLFVQSDPVVLMLVPLMPLMAAIMFDEFTTALTGITVTSVGIMATIWGMGPIASVAGLSIVDGTEYVQLFLGMTVIPALLIGSAVAERDRASEALVRKSSEIAEANLVLSETIRQRDVLLGELQHRVRNSLQIVISLLNLRTSGIADPAARQTVREATRRVEAMAMAHKLLYGSANPDGAPLGEFIPELCELLSDAYALTPGAIEVRTVVGGSIVPVEKMVPVVLILNELISNAYKHAFPGGRAGVVSVSFREDAGPEGEATGTVVVSDDGVGLPADLNIESCGSMGFTIMRALVKQIGGTVSVERRDATIFRVEFPL